MAQAKQLVKDSIPDKKGCPNGIHQEKLCDAEENDDQRA